MREVNRKNVTKPSCLDTDLTLEINSVKTSGKINSSIYRHIDVSRELKLLYSEKCYLCEKDISVSYQIEHYLPWSKAEPKRAYEWENLHLSCDKCNHRKRKKNYKVFKKGTNVVADILILDPSNLPSGYTINKLIKFESNRKCIAIAPSVPKVKKTVEFLNEIEPKTDRDNRWDEVEILLWENRELTLLWETINSMEKIVLPKKLSKRKKILEALKFANNFYQLFLKESTPFSKCICDILLVNKNFSKKGIKKNERILLES